MAGRPFTHYGRPLALDPKAFGMIWDMPKRPEVRIENNVAVVDVRGPLVHHDEAYCDSYDAIKARIAEAVKERPRAVLMSIDSPGGMVSGLFDTTEEIRAVCDAAGVPLLAYIDGQSTSAAYALACVASKVFVPPAGMVGSIGVIDALIDATAQDSMLGLKYTLVTSGARKADGNPHAPTSDGAIKNSQAAVTELAGMFFEHVAKYRGIATDRLEGLQAAVVHGAQAVTLGLADAVMTYDQVLALAGSGVESTAAPAATGKATMADESDTDAVRAALQAFLDDDKNDEKSKARARKALAAYDEAEDDADDAEAEDHKEPDEDDMPMKSEDGEPDEDDKKEGKKAAKSNAVAALARHSGNVEARLATVEKALESEQRKTLRASRPDVSKGVHDALASLPLAEYRAALAKIERPAKPKPAATAVVNATRGDTQNDHGGSRLSPDAKSALDARMGLVKSARGVAFDGHTLRLGAETPTPMNGAK